MRCSETQNSFEDWGLWGGGGGCGMELGKARWLIEKESKYKAIWTFRIRVQSFGRRIQRLL